MDNLDNITTPETEVEVDKAAKFKETSVDLVRRAILAIEKLEKCANQKQFEYTEEQIETMFAAIEESVADTKAKFKIKKEFSW
jgi:hypothetical protein